MTKAAVVLILIVSVSLGLFCFYFPVSNSIPTNSIPMVLYSADGVAHPTRAEKLEERIKYCLHNFRVIKSRYYFIITNWTRRTFLAMRGKPKELTWHVNSPDGAPPHYE